MKFLRYLCIGRRRTGPHGLVGPIPDSFMVHDDALGYVKLMSELCPSLRYVKISFRAWNIGAGSHKSLRQLSEKEERDIEFLEEHKGWWYGL
jgi:hypothetical protein